MSPEARLRSFRARRDVLLDELAGLDEAALMARPAAGKWSILEIVEHMVVAERDVFRALGSDGVLRHRERTLRHRFAYVVVMAILRFGVPVRVPSAAMLPQGGRSLAELRAMWDENHAWLERHLAERDEVTSGQAVFRHPVAGPLTTDQAMRMARVHLERHIGQIRRNLRLSTD